MAKKRKKTRKESPGVTRRDMLKMGGAAGAATFLGPTMLTSWKAYASQTTVSTPPAEPVLCGTIPPASPPTRPFVDVLPVPHPAVPRTLHPTPIKEANTAGGEAARDDHQRWEEFLPAVFYFQEARASLHTFHTDLQPSYIWGFNGKFPAQTILNAYGAPALVRFKNSLPNQVDHTGFGRSETTVHLHNGHTASESDGFAGDFFGNVLFKVVGAGAPGTDKWVVNGKIQPKLHVTRRKYRFRILNTGPTKIWNLKLIGPTGTQVPWTVVAVDANFLHTPWEISSSTTALPTRDLQIHVASRYDVIVDFSQFPVGSSVYLRELTTQNVGVPTPDPAPGLPIGNVVMRFDVISNAVIPDTPPIPNTLVELPPVPTPDQFFEWRFTLEGGRFKVNGLEFDANRVDHAILRGAAEEWHLRNNVLAGNWTHPVHIHFEEGRIMERTTRPDPINQPDLNVPVNLQGVPGDPNPDEHFANARRDVYPLPGQHSIRLRMKFRDFHGRYLIHCHNMNHEDAFMMVRWDIVDTIAELRQKREQIAQQRRDAGVPVEDGLPKSRKEME